MSARAYDLGMAQRACLVLSSAPDDDYAVELATDVADRYADDEVEVIAWEVVDELPGWLNVATADQLSAHRRDAGDDAVFMVIYMGTEDELT